jgi:glyoxylase-like metal-dependent hydrolase (beta-lactamase superfamily II)
MAQLPAVERFDSDSGAKIYRIPMIVFPNGFMAYSFLVLDAGPPTLIDTGSGIADSNEHLLQGLQAIHDDFGEAIHVADIAHILITHGHMDHFGGLAFMAEQTGATVGIHELDRRVLTNYEERVAIATKDLRIYLERAGIKDAARQELIDMYGFAKKHIRSVDVDFSLEEDAVFEGMQFVHAPGHCPGQVCIILGNVMLTADHILSLTTPHQAPESITHYTGLGHYKDSLRKIAKIDSIELAIGSHEEAMRDIYGRIEAIQASHDRKLNRVFDIVRESPAPSTIYEITLKMYPDKAGYESLLALEEAGAHIEYLYQHGKISVANLDEVETEDNPALRYTAL